MSVKPGIDVLLEEHLPLLTGLAGVGLVSQAAAVNGRQTTTLEALRQAERVQLAAIFTPEHGWSGRAEAGERVESIMESPLGLPIYSLYGKERRPTAAYMAGLDLLIVDLRCVGVRFYTYVTTLLYVLQAAALQGIPVIVCDRPNPLGGIIMEGPLLKAEFESFVGCGPLPIRHGLTMGELARLFRQLWGIAAELQVIACAGWQRAMWFDQTDLAWTPPSPALPRLESALLYPGLCLIEGTNLSEGRGTANPFERVGAPWLDGERLSQAMAELDLPGITFRPIRFKPASSKWAGQWCGGVQLQIVDRGLLRPVTVALHLIAVIRRLYPADFAWRLPHFDQLMGSDLPRRQLEAGCPAAEITAGWASELAAFAEQRRGVLLYV
jgi:uncharacterized protein YbbC (DUF1343 family)